MTDLEKIADGLSPSAWKALGQLRKYPSLPMCLNVQYGQALVRRGLAKEIVGHVYRMTELGQELWVKHGPVDDRRYL